jgi:hypothetical protein
VTFTDNADGTGTLSGTPAAGTSGIYNITFSASNGVGENAVQNLTLAVNQPPAITSGNATSFTVGAAESFAVTTSGFPAPALLLGGAALPSGVTFTDNGDGTGTLSGTPAAGTGGTYNITFTGSNGVGDDVVQNFTLTVNQPPAITSGNATSFVVGAAGSFTVTTSGFPAPAMVGGGALPTGVTFTDNGNGTGTLSGTPAAGTDGTYDLTFGASNGVGDGAVQNFTLTVNQPPTITSGDAATFVVGAAGTFTVTTTGFPTPGITRGGAALPGGVTFTDNGNGTGTLGGTPATGTGGTYNLTFTASNGVGEEAVQNFTLRINTPPVAGADTLGTDRNQSVNAAVSKLLANDRDADGDTLGITSVASVSAQGGSVALAGGVITYSPPVDFTGADSFTYTLSDGRGGSATAIVAVTVRSPNAANNQGTITATENGFLIRFHGVPSVSYKIQFSSDLATWEDLDGPIQAGPTGIYEAEDVTDPMPEQRFYRGVLVP